jgi:hypothetical protein
MANSCLVGSDLIFFEGHTWVLGKNIHIYGSSKREWEFYKQTWGHLIDL